MGFSLKRALQGAVMGAAHEAGEVFDGMIAEERKLREAAAAQDRAKELATFQADLIMDRERSRDEIKEKAKEREEEKVSKQMQGYYAAAREAGFDPNKLDGMRFIASKALEDGKAGIYDKITDNIDRREKNLADAENRKFQLQSAAEARAARKRGEADADHEKQLQRLTTYANRFDVPGFDDDGKKVVDKRASNAAFNYGHDEIVNKGRKPAAVFAELAEINSRVDALRNLPDYAKAAPDVLFKTAVNPNWDKKPAPPAAGGAAQAPAAKAKPQTGGGIFGRMFGGSTPDATYSAGDLPQQW
jgi:hypothetical protein